MAVICDVLCKLRSVVPVFVIVVFTEPHSEWAPGLANILLTAGRALYYPKGAGDRISPRLSYSLVDGFVGHLRIEIQIDFLKLNVYNTY